MEKPSYPERNGGGLMRLPTGFRFRPTDEELVVHYLKRKVHSLPLPASVIPEWDVFQSYPWDLPGDLRENRYFFNKTKEDGKKCISSSSSIIRRMVGGCGYWKAIGGYKQILASGSNQILGMKRSLAFYLGKRRSDWMMREYYCIAGSPYSTQNLVTQLVGNWVVCRIHQRKLRNAKNHGHGNSNIRKKTTRHQIKELMSRNIASTPSPPPSSSCSSGMTELSSISNQQWKEDQEVSSE